jgi:hypothetical protein
MVPYVLQSPLSQMSYSLPLSHSHGRPHLWLHGYAHRPPCRRSLWIPRWQASPGLSTLIVLYIPTRMREGSGLLRVRLLDVSGYITVSILKRTCDSHVLGVWCILGRKTKGQSTRKLSSFRRLDIVRKVTDQLGISHNIQGEARDHAAASIPAIPLSSSICRSLLEFDAGRPKTWTKVRRAKYG